MIRLSKIIRRLSATLNWLKEVSQRPAVLNPIAVSLGAIAGSLSRYYLGLWFIQQFGLNFPYGTFFINITGCLAMGFFVTLSLEQIINIHPRIRLLVATGFLGSYTTFSTYQLDADTLLEKYRLEAAFIYWTGSAVLGVIFIQLGVIFAKLCGGGN